MQVIRSRIIRKMSTIKKIEALMAREKHTPTILATLSGVPQPTIHRMLKGHHQQPRQTTLDKIVAVYGLTFAELLNTPIEYIREGKKLEQPQTPTPLEQDLKKSGFTTIQTYPIRVVNWRDIEKYLGGDVSVATRTIHTTLNEEGIFAIVLEDSDDSMEPEFSGGSILVVNPNKPARSGHFVLARAKQDSDLTVKQLKVDAGQNYLKPLNKDYKTIHAEDLVVVALVRQLIREYAD
jgi:hypothetical protein